MNRTKEVFDSGFTLDDIFTESLNLNNLVSSNKSKDSKIDNIQKFFRKNLKLRNVSKRIYWNRVDSNINVK
jgi:hypothetical protein